MNKDRFAKYVKICERAESLGITTGDRTNSLMDIESADLKFNLRLDDWLNADEFNFVYDFCGIQNHIVGDDFPATDFNHFVPRFAGVYSGECKQDILDALLPALQKTRNLHDLVTLIYNADKEMVIATFASGGTKLVNVAMDSGTAMVRDVVGNIV